MTHVVVDSRDAPLLRLCSETGAVIISVEYDT